MSSSCSEYALRVTSNTTLRPSFKEVDTLFIPHYLDCKTLLALHGQKAFADMYVFVKYCAQLLLSISIPRVIQKLKQEKIVFANQNITPPTEMPHLAHVR